MIEFILKYLNARLKNLVMFQDIFTLVELITKEDQTFPAQYLTKGEYKQVSDADFVRGIVYHRLTGAVTRDEIEGASSGCEVQIRQTYPMRLVCCAPKNMFQKDNAFTDVKFAENVINAITQKNVKSLRRELKADVVTIQIQNYNVDRKAVLADEFTGFDFQVNYEFVYLSVDYNVVVEAGSACFQYWLCDDEYTGLNLCPAPDSLQGGDSENDDQFGEETVPDLACDEGCEELDFIEGGDSETEFTVVKGINQ